MGAWECANGCLVGGLGAGEHSCLPGMECCSWLLPKARVSTFIFLQKSLNLWEVVRESLMCGQPGSAGGLRSFSGQGHFAVCSGLAFWDPGRCSQAGASGVSPYCRLQRGWSGAKLLPREVRPIILPSSPRHNPKALGLLTLASWSLGDPQPLGEARLLALKAELPDCSVSEFTRLSRRRGRLCWGWMLDEKMQLLPCSPGARATPLKGHPVGRTQEWGAVGLALARQQATSALFVSFFFLIK